ncbi:helix-turn-helix domain-containing protein [Actinacidiphila acididurans]|uniref:Helix-turn-helix transcriptional regulator n=1 Tax=Actinacidiphila acididurans TaxID=2784346 RepID=A0ABS2U1J3_9ACTN|nr:helix-turn-helix domain-containing protein [Actinacidiphila acididurans]MBM9508058.1 helix-turn-helix transcriptional regulator [Actinacidiphila acididurans]
MRRDPGALASARQWHWATPEAQAVLATRNLGTILRFYRRTNRLSQTELGAVLGYDKTYISLLEGQKRTLNDVGSLEQVSRLLGLPPHVLGITTAADSDHQLVLQLGQSTVRLAEIARQSGRAADAVAELWPLVARLEARVADGHAERESLRLLAQARVGLGVALGHVLPEERLATAAHWTGKALEIAAFFGDAGFTSHVLRMHGNELRKAGLRGAAVNRLGRAAALAPDLETRAAVLPLLARAAGTLGNAELFDRAMREAETTLDQVEHTSLVNSSSLHEVRLRGLLATGRTHAAIHLADQGAPADPAMAPQWRVIEKITIARVHIAAGSPRTAVEVLTDAIREATRQRLPHQLQRVVRVADVHLPEVTESATHALAGLREEMAA